MWVLIVIMSAGPYNQYSTVSMQEFSNYQRCAEAAYVVKSSRNFEGGFDYVKCVKK